MLIINSQNFTVHTYISAPHSTSHTHNKGQDSPIHTFKNHTTKEVVHNYRAVINRLIYRPLLMKNKVSLKRKIRGNIVTLLPPKINVLADYIFYKPKYCRSNSTCIEHLHLTKLLHPFLLRLWSPVKQNSLIQFTLSHLTHLYPLAPDSCNLHLHSRCPLSPGYDTYRVEEIKPSASLVDSLPWTFSNTEGVGGQSRE